MMDTKEECFDAMNAVIRPDIDVRKGTTLVLTVVINMDPGETARGQGDLTVSVDGENLATCRTMADFEDKDFENGPNKGLYGAIGLLECHTEEVVLALTSNTLQLLLAGTTQQNPLETVQ